MPLPLCMHLCFESQELLLDPLPGSLDGTGFHRAACVYAMHWSEGVHHSACQQCGPSAGRSLQMSCSHTSWRGGCRLKLM